MKTAIILHGKPSKKGYFDPQRGAQSNEHWLPWIQRKLLLAGILAQAIELPEPYEPVYADWKSVFEQFEVDEETMLIGHSCGGGFLVRWLSENKVKVGKVVLVAPWLDPDHELNTGFFSFEIDLDVPKRTKGLTIFNSDDDENSIQKSVVLLKSKWPDAKLIELANMGHFVFGDMNTQEFPELEKELLGQI